MQAEVITSRQKWNSLIRLLMYVQDPSTHNGSISAVKRIMYRLNPSTPRW